MPGKLPDLNIKENIKSTAPNQKKDKELDKQMRIYLEDHEFINDTAYQRGKELGRTVPNKEIVNEMVEFWKKHHQD